MLNRYYLIKIFPIIIIIVACVLAGLSLLHRGIPPTHDGEYHVIRFYQFFKTFNDGQLYPRWQPDLNNGYGSPLLNYNYPLPNYIATLFHYAGISFIDSFKIEMFLAIITGGVFFYLWTKEYWGIWGGVISSIFYTFSPYHFVDIYIRGSVGEVWALSFFPAFLWSITKLIKTNKIIYLPVSSIFLSIIIFSHNILAYMFFIFMFVYLFYIILRSDNIKISFYRCILVVLLGLSTSAIFWIPALVERSYVVGLQIFDVTAHFVEIYQLIFPSWGSGFSAGDLGTEMSFQIGLANIFVVIVTVIILLKNKFMIKTKSLLVLFIACFILIFILMLDISKIIWIKLPLFNYFQFPWRLLSLEILIASFFAGFLVRNYNFLQISKKRIVIILFMILLPILTTINYAKFAYYEYRFDNYYFTKPNFINGTNTPGNAFNTKWFNTKLQRNKEKIIFTKGKGVIKKEVMKSTYYKYKFYIEKVSTIIANIAYFPGWKVFANGIELNTNINKDGLISFDLLPGEYNIEIKMVNTPIRTIAEIISFLSVLTLTIIIKAQYKIKR